MKEQGHRRTARLLAPGFWSRKTSQSERVEDPNPDCCSSSDMSTSRVYRNRCVESLVCDTIQGQTSGTGVEQMAVSLGSRGFLYDQGSLSSGIPVFRSLDSGVCRVVGCQQEQDRLMAQEHHAPSTR